MILSILAPFVALFTVFYLFSPPDTLLSSYYCQLFCIDVVAIRVLSIHHQDMWKKHWDFLVYWNYTIFLLEIEMCPSVTSRPVVYFSVVPTSSPEGISGEPRSIRLQ